MNPDAHVGSATSFTDATHTVIPDEAALRRAFDQFADSAAMNAATELGEAAALAPRVVEHVFLNVWRARGTIASEAALVAYLDEAVRHDSARVLSRRMAAKRLGGGVDDRPREATPQHPSADHAAPTPYDRETTWAHVVRGIHGGTDEQVHAKALAAAHHETAEHIKGIGRDSGHLRPVLTAAGVAACALGGIWLLDHASRGAKLEAAVTASSARVVEAQPAQVGTLTLDDGSRVRIAPESRIFIPKEFGEDLRGIRVEGAATVDVAQGMSSPLVVRADGATISAEGTSFMVRAYPADSVTLVVLQEGRVTVKRGDEQRSLTAGQALAVPDSSPMREPTAAEREEATAWMENRLVVHERRLADILPEFQRWYNMKIYAADTRILDRRVSVRASLDSVRQAIAAVEAAATVKFGYLDDKMVFHDGPKAPDPGRK